MNKHSNGKKKLHKITGMWIAAIFAIAILLAGSALPVKAAGTTKKMANLVIFVKMKDDQRDIFNAVNGNYSNWQEIKRMYEGDGGSSVNYFTNYIKAISEGQLEVVDVFPQEYTAEDGTQKVEVLELTQSSYATDDSIVQEVVQNINDNHIQIDTNAVKLDYLESGILDNLTIIVQGDDINGNTHAYRTVYGGSETFGANQLTIRNYNALHSSMLVEDDASLSGGKSQQGVIAHEFLHNLGFPDLYRYDSSGVPVGMWDIMGGTSYFLQYPLGYLRAQNGWITAKEISTDGTYTLTAVSEQGGDKLITIKTPMTESDSEVICLEYRKKYDGYEGAAFERSIYSSGLLMYRVNTTLDSATNSAGDNYIYVYRPDVTDPEKAADAVNGVNLVSKAALDVSAGETEYGSTDLTKTFQDNTLYYSDGRNSGVYISNLKLSEDGNQVTFQINFADYSENWDTMGKNDESSTSGDPFFYTDPATGKLYLTYLTESGGTQRIVVKSWDETTSAWVRIGDMITVANSQPDPRVAVCGGELYLAYLDGTKATPVYRKWNGSAWSSAAAIDSASYPKTLQLIVDGNDIYAAYAASASGKDKLVIRNLKTGALITDSLTATDFSNPSIVKMGTIFYVAYADFANGNGKIAAYQTTTSSWSTVKETKIASSNQHILQVHDGKLYAFLGVTGSNPVVSVYDGSSWKDSTVSLMERYYSTSMFVINNTVYLAYLDTKTNQGTIIRQTGSGYEKCYDNLGTSMVYFDTAGYGNTIYAASKVANSETVVVRRKTLSQTEEKPTTPSTPVTKGWIVGEDGKLRCYDDSGNMITNSFAFDGKHTYYLQADGTPMTDRLTYHPDGEHIIYFDENGYEIFNEFRYCPSVGYTCYFDSNGYIYKDQITFVGDKAYYLDENGKMKQNEWFCFANGRDWGFAEVDGSLRTNGFSYDTKGRVVFYHWNGMVARGLITDGVWYYSMDVKDGHYLGQFRVNN